MCRRLCSCAESLTRYKRDIHNDLSLWYKNEVLRFNEIRGCVFSLRRRSPGWSFRYSHRRNLFDIFCQIFFCQMYVHSYVHSFMFSTRDAANRSKFYIEGNVFLNACLLSSKGTLESFSIAFCFLKRWWGDKIKLRAFSVRKKIMCIKIWTENLLVLYKKYKFCIINA